MAKILKNTPEQKFKIHLAAFTLMILPPIFLYYAADNNSTGWIWFLIGLVVIGNILAVLTK